MAKCSGCGVVGDGHFFEYCSLSCFVHYEALKAAAILPPKMVSIAEASNRRLVFCPTCRHPRRRFVRTCTYCLLTAP